ncbi:MAG: cofactor-independent phosphoglycerate mutase [Candidatus Saganbacteria bacterium]|nr:cofactor-independent phosphoglycerate mutase [Candidatus Saganbacteria bacterium]
MKYIILVGDGMPDRPLKELGGSTPLQAAETLNMDLVASSGVCGMANFVPGSMPPGSDVANLSLFGYDPLKYYTGRGPFEAASMGVALEENDVAFRCNLVTIKDGVMDDFSAGHVTTAEARKMVLELNSKLSSDEVKFYPGVSYRHLCVIKNGPRQAECTPPHDISGKNIGAYLPKGQGESLLNELMQRSIPFLQSSAVNKKRVKAGQKPATQIWLWGQGVKPSMPTYEQKYNVTGSVITAVDLIKGIGVYAGLDVINVPGATGYLDTNYKGKAEYALQSLKVKDFVFVHVESPDECGHNGDIKGKIKAIEDFDKMVVETILKGVRDFKEWRVLVTADHPTPIAIKTHARGMVPFAVCGTGIEKGGIKKFSEKTIEKSRIKIEKGYTLPSKFFKGVF